MKTIVHGFLERLETIPCIGLLVQAPYEDTILADNRFEKKSLIYLL